MPNFITVSDLYLNLDRVTYVRKEERHGQEMYVAYFDDGSGKGLALGPQYKEDLDRLLIVSTDDRIETKRIEDG